MLHSRNKYTGTCQAHKQANVEPDLLLYCNEPRLVTPISQQRESSPDATVALTLLFLLVCHSGTVREAQSRWKKKKSNPKKATNSFVSQKMLVYREGQEFPHPSC